MEEVLKQEVINDIMSEDKKEVEDPKKIVGQLAADRSALMVLS